MPIRFPCNACGQLLGIATRKVGTEIHCPTCGLAVIVPDEEQAKLLRQRARGENKQPFTTPDTPPEISIPRERHEAFDGGLESFLTQLDVSPAASKPLTAASVSPSIKTPPPKPPPPKAPAAPVSAKSTTPSTPKNESNGTHIAPPQSVVPPPPPATKPIAPPAPAPKKQSPPASPQVEIPLAFEDHEVSVLSAADLLELADEPPSQPALPPSAKAPTPPKQNPTVAQAAVSAPSKTVAALAKPPVAPPATKQSTTPPPAPIAAPAAATIPDIAPLVKISSPAVPDFGFDFSSPVSAPAISRKAEPAPAASISASPTTATVPTAPFDNAVWISRRAIYTHVAILVLVSIATFLIGWISGGAGAHVPGANNTDPIRFEALIQYVDAKGKTLPDDGAVVLLWPKQAKPLERLSIKRLTPSEPAPPPDFPTLKVIETLRGAYARTNAQGEVRDLMLAEPGEYYVLVISRNLARPAMEPINEKVVPILGDLFGGEAVALLGTRQYKLKSYTIAGTSTLNHTFGAPVEK